MNIEYEKERIKEYWCNISKNTEGITSTVLKLLEVKLCLFLVFPSDVELRVLLGFRPDRSHLLLQRGLGRSRYWTQVSDQRRVDVPFWKHWRVSVLYAAGVSNVLFLHLQTYIYVISPFATPPYRFCVSRCYLIISYSGVKKSEAANRTPPYRQLPYLSLEKQYSYDLLS